MNLSQGFKSWQFGCSPLRGLIEGSATIPLTCLENVSRLRVTLLERREVLLAALISKPICKSFEPVLNEFLPF